MSTKIYQAFRAPQEHFREALEFLHGTLLSASVDNLKTWADGLDEEKIKERYKIPAEKSLRLEMRLHAIYETLADLYRSHKDDILGCGFNIWFHSDGMVYFIPWGMPGITNSLDKVELPDFVEEYAYWNNTDPPEWAADDEGYARWEERGRVWEDVGPNSGGADHFRWRLTHEVVTASHWAGTLVLFDEYRRRFGKSEEE